MALRQQRATRGLRPFTASVVVGAIETIRSSDDPRQITARLEKAVRALLNDPPGDKDGSPG
jgi:hypothetical protein